MASAWHHRQNCDSKDNPRPLHGTLRLVPKKENIKEERLQFPQSCNYDVWSGMDETGIQVKIMEEEGQPIFSNPMMSCNTSLGDQLYQTKVSRSQSFSENGIKMDYLITTDPRRFSFASNESGKSSTSSELWAYEPHERKKNFSPLFQTPEPLQRESIWGESEFLYSSDKCHSIKENAGYDSDYFNQLSGSMRDSSNFMRRSSGFSSDSERASRRPSSNLERRYSRFSVDTSRRDSEFSSLSDRRSSGFVSDFDRRDSSSSSSSISHFGGYSDSSPLVHSPAFIHPGMEHVPQWLKSLRLHKYTDLIMNMTYTEMIQLTEEKLESLNVTKGARRKIVSSIQKLEERPNILTNIDTELEIEDCDIKKILADLESVLKSPIRIEEEENPRSRHDSAIDSGTEVSEDEEQEREIDVPCSGRKLIDLIMKTLRKVCSLILLSQHTDTKHVAQFTTLLDLCLSRDCYLPRQKQLLISWKQKLYSIWGPLPSPHQNVGQKEKSFHLKTPHINPPSLGQHVGLPVNWAGWTHSPSEESKEHLSVPSPGEAFQQRKDHPFLMPRNSAPNIGSSLMFSSPLSYKKRYSFQDGALSPRTSLHHRNSLPTLEPHLPPSAVKNDHHSRLTRPDSDWRTSLHSLGLRLSDFQCGSDTVSEVVDVSNEKVDRNDSTKETTPTTILVTQADSPSDSELNTRLETLCLAVTEQALE